MTDIWDILPLKTGGILSVTGAGGKTSLMFHLAASLAGAGKRVLTTTTTKIFQPSPVQSKTLIISDSVEELLDEAAIAASMTYDSMALPLSGKSCFIFPTREDLPAARMTPATFAEISFIAFFF